MRTSFSNLFQLFSFLAIALFFVSCAEEEPVKEESVRPVKYAKVGHGGALKERTFTGTAKSGTETKLSFKVNGNIKSLNVKVGQEIKANALIATVDASDIQLEYEQADASVKNADAQEKSAKSAYERVRSLYENNNASLSEYESAKAQYESAKANESSAKKSRKLAKAKLSYTRLFAPVSGKVATVDAEVNENIQAGQQIVMLSSEGDLEVNLGVPESFISKINIQDKASVAFSSVPGKKFTGVVSEASFSINSQTSTYPVIIKLEGDASEVRPGMAANVTFNLKSETTSDQMMIAAKAVGADQEGNFVFVLNANDDGTYIAQKQYVKIGQLSSNGFEITEGINEGDFIATAGLNTLLDGMKVKLYEE